jgi:hypothetical protein
VDKKAQRKRGLFNLKCNIKSYIFYESQTFPNFSLPQIKGWMDRWSDGWIGRRKERREGGREMSYW